MDTLTKKLNIGDTISISKFNSNQNSVYRINTTKGIYVVKEYTKDAISNNYNLKKRKKQIKVSEKLVQNNINCMMPILIKEKSYFIKINGLYYIIYNYLDGKTLTNDKLTLKHINLLAKTQAKIHKLNIESDLPCTYKKCNINYDIYLNKYQKIDKNLYNTLKDNIDILKTITKNCNQNIKKMKSNLCISHNDYKSLNILWNNMEMTIIDFDATGKANPTCCLAESAFTFSNNKTHINYDFYKEYIKSYMEEYREIKENYREAIYVSFNGKLLWLSYIMEKCQNEKYIIQTIEMINELVLYYKNINKFVEIYDEVNSINNNSIF